MGEADAEDDVSFRFVVPGWFRSRSAAADSFVPTDIAWAWYWEADQGDLLQAPAGAAASADGDPVGFVLHHNAGGDFRQATSANKPTLKTGANGINGHPVLRFDGTDDYLRDTALAALTDTQGTLILVAKRSATAGVSQTLVATADEATTVRLWNFRYRLTTDLTSITQIDNDTQDIVNANALDTNAHLLVVESDGAAYTIREDGVEATLVAEQGANTGDWWGDTSARDSVTIGALSRTTVGAFLTGDIAGVWYSSTKLDAGDLADMEAYLADKYGIAI